jgi:hypothetical protein
MWADEGEKFASTTFLAPSLPTLVLVDISMSRLGLELDATLSM